MLFGRWWYDRALLLLSDKRKSRDRAGIHPAGIPAGDRRVYAPGVAACKRAQGGLRPCLLIPFHNRRQRPAWARRGAPAGALGVCPGNGEALLFSGPTYFISDVLNRHYKILPGCTLDHQCNNLPIACGCRQGIVNPHRAAGH